MPRRPRIFVEGGIYHVYNRFARGAEIFREGDEAERFRELLQEVKRRDGLTVFAWVLMSNHFHLALRSGPAPLSRTLGFVQARLSQQYNRVHRSTGPLWQSRYKAKLVDDDDYVNQLIAYIHLNPVSAGIVDDPVAYRHSGHHELLKKTPSPLVDVDQVLSLYGGTLRTARRRYVRHLEGAREVAWQTELPGRLPWWVREPDRPVEVKRPDAWIDERGLSTGLDRPPVTAREFLMISAEILELPLEVLTAPGSGHQITRDRSLILSLAVERWRLRPSDFASFFSRRNDVVSRWVRWGALRRMEDGVFRAMYDKLDRVLSHRLSDSTLVARE